ncbi:uncharacterized protein [Temnothorax nylanderi]|uniref:uncharacterized protein n=1 Tax=Temnothorax nylanderi TaxID=102681 RepID=UPI003A8C2EBF
MPRLELLGALTLARLYHEASTAFTFEPDGTVFRTDSMIVLHWLKKSPSILKPFEANRVKEIQEISKEFKWQHVKSEHNPADALLRGQLPREFLKNESWFNGPSWLKQSEANWPISLETSIKELPGLKKTICLVSQVDSDDIFK